MIYSIIGCNYGDEAKALITDYFCDKLRGSTLNIRHSGGANAGHTVVTRDGNRHVASHVGSGCLAGVPTYLSEYFICNPLLFCKEINEFVKPFIPTVYVSPNSLCTTPYCMLLNQMIEEARGDNRHGSVGVGIWETIERNKNPKYGFKMSLILQDHSNWQDLVLRKLSDIRMEWANHRLIESGFEYLMPEFRHKIYDMTPRMDSEFINACTIFRRYAKLADVNILRGYDNLVFEGSQGLMLDESYGTMPYVTCGNTSSKNVVSLLQEAGLDQELLNVIYTTRWYTTRHGRGPLEHELDGKPSVNIVDHTNRPNPWQESLRYAWLDMDILYKAIAWDLQFVKNLPHKHHLAVTCLDQANEFITYYNNKQSHIARVDTFIDMLATKLNVLDLYLSHGPTRQDVTKVQS